MKAPSVSGSPIDNRRYRKWLSDFTGYRHVINEERIDRWLDQFQPNDKDLAARILDCVDFIGHEQMFAAFRGLLRSIDGWSEKPTKRRGCWRFVAFSSSAGESGDEMLHKFRVANGLAAKRYNELFVYKSDLMQAQMGANDTVVFLDDFSGTGKQACDTWPEIQELLPGHPRVILFLIAASSFAVKRVSNQTDICCLPHYLLKEQENIFSIKCRHFTNDDRSKLLRYCVRADNKYPKGFGECGFVIVFVHSCPNNSIPILHANHQNWEGLFRRYDNMS